MFFGLLVISKKKMVLPELRLIKAQKTDLILMETLSRREI